MHTHKHIITTKFQGIYRGSQIGSYNSNQGPAPFWSPLFPNPPPNTFSSGINAVSVHHSMPSRYVGLKSISMGIIIYIYICSQKKAKDQNGLAAPNFK